ncbi:ShlB/FhaC/HecB family hemolysin secretion/activation protein [Pseudomonas sp. LP_7_YM]|uniref:ShlB/FhaC/HecB family hemolysin secretion/activation protein n=1 Tax=Pseudomonas sp. LP_7_YM TaxID=2485137 RepID=UPI00105C5E35|nr:POTRA domain-containing protein [Pseudomonas sp. LP_7_YM]TDV65844.1 hemolysin activation/secretion protein [Pseudomonas sp. LP_7_YM]
MRACIPVLMLGICTSASFANADALPAYLNSNDRERRLPAPNLPADAYRPATPAPQVPIPPADTTALMMNTKVGVRKIRIEGGTVYPLEQLGAAYQPLIGRDATLAELIEATRGITQRYQNDGYLLSYAFLPTQGFEQGLVRVVLVEGYVRDYRLEGEIGNVSAYLQKLVDKIKQERPLTRKTFERYTSLMSRVPGVTLQAQVPPPGTTDGATTLIAQASRKPLTSTLSTTDDNRQGLQALLGVSSNAQTSTAEQLTFSALFPPGDDREHYYRLDYSQFLNTEGTQLNLSASHYRSEPATNIALNNGLELNQRRDNDRLSIGFTCPLIAARNEWVSAGARVYAVNDKIRYDVVGFPLSIQSRTDIRALAIEGDWRKSTDRQLRILSGGVYRGIDGMGAKTDDNTYDLDFFRARLSGVQSDKFFEHWQGVFSAALYWSNDTLPDSERAQFGGQNFGRGYPADQASGDKGWGVAYEVNYNFMRDGNWVKVLQPYGVLDTARTRFNQLQVKDSRLSSSALGLRLGDGRYYNIAVEAAKPMSDPGLDSFNRNPRFTLSFSYQL